MNITLYDNQKTADVVTDYILGRGFTLAGRFNAAHGEDGSVVQADVLAVRSAKPDCAGKVVALGRPLFPYEGFMVVRADQRESNFGDMIDRIAS